MGVLLLPTHVQSTRRVVHYADNINPGLAWGEKKGAEGAASSSSTLPRRADVHVHLRFGLKTRIIMSRKAFIPSLHQLGLGMHLSLVTLGFGLANWLSSLCLLSNVTVASSTSLFSHSEGTGSKERSACVQGASFRLMQVAVHLLMDKAFVFFIITPRRLSLSH